MKKSRYLSAKEAIEILGITPATLYTYVSRGMVRSESAGDDHRVRRYNAEDVNKLKERKEQRKNPAKVAETALHWGTPILESALTLIIDDGLYYRGYNALKLATTAQVEQVAALLWTDGKRSGEQLFPNHDLIDPPLEILRQIDSPLSLLQKLQIGLILVSMNDLAAYNLTPDKVAETGAQILQVMTAILADHHSNRDSISVTLGKAWAPGHPNAARLLNAALILCADHELNVSSFTARVVASAEARPYEVILAGLAAIQGALHGGTIERVEALLHEIGSPDHIYATIAGKLRRGERVPGFGHPLYPDGDPRCKLILSLITEVYADSPTVQLARSTVEVVQNAIALEPTIDFALAILVQVLDLPRGAGLAIFALGRTIGWISHAIEQYSAGTIIRPRAIYTGVMPRD